MSLRREIYKKSVTPMTMEVETNGDKPENNHWVRDWYDPPMNPGDNNNNANMTSNGDVVVSGTPTTPLTPNAPYNSSSDVGLSNTPSLRPIGSTTPVENLDIQLQGAKIKTWIISEKDANAFKDCLDEEKDCFIQLNDYKYPDVLLPQQNKSVLSKSDTAHINGNNGTAAAGEISVSDIKSAVGAGDGSSGNTIF